MLIVMTLLLLSIRGSMIRLSLKFFLKEVESLQQLGYSLNYFSSSSICAGPLAIDFHFKTFRNHNQISILVELQSSDSADTSEKDAIFNYRRKYLLTQQVVVEWSKQVSHVWKLLSLKESLWVKWIHAYKLKGRSFWDYPLRGNMSWGWRKVLQLRPL
ncbi:hypothetical protein Tco_1535513, partial [Tanacetum coccineum]